MSTTSRPCNPLVGALVLSGGVVLLTAILLDAMYGLPWTMPSSWYVHRATFGALALLACAAGWYLQRSPIRRTPAWTPAVAGRRFHRLIVYSRHDCHLCDDAKAVLALYLEFLPAIEEVDIDADPGLKSRFGSSVPVVEIDGVVRFQGKVDEILLRRLIEGTPPVSSDA